MKTKPLNSEIFRSRASHELEILCGLDGKLHIVAVGPGRAVDHDFPARARCPFLRGIPLILQIEPLSSLPRADIRPFTSLRRLGGLLEQSAVESFLAASAHRQCPCGYSRLDHRQVGDRVAISYWSSGPRLASVAPTITAERKF